MLILTLAIIALALPALALGKAPRSFYGISAVDPTPQDVKRMAHSGFGTVRFELSWRIIQRTRKGGYDWGYVDARMRDIAAAEMHPTVVVYGTPRFVHKSDGFYPPTSSRADLREWRDFLAAAARRYGPGGQFFAENPGLPEYPIRQWIVWNEQNSRAFWRPQPDPKDYAKLLKASDSALSSVDPKAKIVLGGMYGYPRDPRSMTAVKFLRKLYRTKGIKRHFDAISLHPYGSGVRSLRKQIEQARAVVKKAGDGSVDMLIGEVGWASTGPSHSEEVVGLKGQANRHRQALRLLLRKRKAWNVIGSYIYLWRDFSTPTACLWCPGAGLVEENGKAKPALKAVRKVIRAGH